MNTNNARFVRPALSALCVGSFATLVGCGRSYCVSLGGCSGGNGLQNVALTAQAFLTMPFMVAQARVDSDLGALAAAGAIAAGGMPDTAAMSLLSVAGLAHALRTPPTFRRHCIRLHDAN